MRISCLTAALVSLALSAATAAAGCGDPAGAGNPPARTAVISSATVVAGGEGVVTGSNLDLLPATISVDGRDVTPSARRTSDIRFDMPAGRACEVDGRPIEIVAGPLRYTAHLTVPTAVRLEPGESRILSRSELSTICLQLPGGAERFVLSVLNPALTESATGEPLLTVRVSTASGMASQADAPGSAVSPEPSSAGSGTNAQGRFDISPGTDYYSTRPETFDPAYATAAVGDTVRWVDFRSPAWYNNSNICRQPKTSVPTFGAVVAAVSTSGRTVIAFDERTQFRAGWTSPYARSRLSRLADIIERWTLPAVREVFGTDFQPVSGAEGRWWHIFRTGISLPTVDDAGLPRSMCPHYSEVATTLAPDVPLSNDDQVEGVAGYLVHEYAHHAEDVLAVRRWGNVFGRGAPHWSGVGESWAQTVQETAARMASGQSTGARYDALKPGSGIPYPDFYATGYGERPDLSPWSGGRGPYDQGTRLLMFLRESWGDAVIESSRERYYGRVMSLPTYDFASMATLAGLDPVVALDRWSLAEATDDLVDPAAVSAQNLPQLRSWVPQDADPLPRVSRTFDSSHAITVAHGSYAALYFYGSESGPGVSLRFADLGSPLFIARITRLR